MMVLAVALSPLSRRLMNPDAAVHLGPSDHAGAIRLGQSVIPDEIAHHREVASRIAGRDAMSVLIEFVFGHAMFGVREYSQSDRAPICDQSLDPPACLLTGRIEIVLSKHPKLRRLDVSQCRHRVIEPRRAKLELIGLL